MKRHINVTLAAAGCAALVIGGGTTAYAVSSGSETPAAAAAQPAAPFAGDPSERIALLRAAPQAKDTLSPFRRATFATNADPSNARAVDVGLKRPVWVYGDKTQLCVAVPLETVVPDPQADGYGSGCAPTATAVTNGAGVLNVPDRNGKLDFDAAERVVVVPDGARTLTVTAPGAAARTVPVTNNVARFTAPEKATASFDAGQGTVTVR